MARVPALAEFVERLAAAWRRPGAVTDGFALLDARAAEDAVEVAFHWRRDPARYLVHFPYPDLPQEALGEDFDLDDAVGELSLLLMEDLDTAFVSWAGRTTTADGVLLQHAGRVPSGWFVGEVPLEASPSALRAARAAMEASGERFAVVASHEHDLEPIADPGRFLDAEGLDGTGGRRAVADGSLLAWLQIDRGEGGSPRAGQAVVVADGAEEARIAVLELRTPDPRAFAELAWAACRAAVEQGRVRLTADPALEGLRALGFRDEGDRLVARHDDLRFPGA
jgi:hypothetical protein